MYNFLFYFIYKYQLKDNKGKVGLSRYMASLIVTIAVFFDFMLVYALARYILYNFHNISIASDTTTNYSSRYVIIVLTIMVLVMYYVYKFFNLDRIKSITDKYEGKKIYTPFNFIKFFTIFFSPLIISIILVQHSIII